MCTIYTAPELAHGIGYLRMGSGYVFVVAGEPGVAEVLGKPAVVLAAVPLCTCPSQFPDRWTRFARGRHC